jgi:hypothetical protein
MQIIGSYNHRYHRQWVYRRQVQASPRSSGRSSSAQARAPARRPAAPPRAPRAHTVLSEWGWSRFKSRRCMVLRL